MKTPVISIIIPTYRKSDETLEMSFKSIVNQSCPKNYYEIIVADNRGTQKIKELAKQYGAKFIEVKGDSPQVCNQRNIGSKLSKGSYIYTMDHDIELSLNLIKNFAILIQKRPDIDAWYIPYKIKAKGKLLTKIRNFEEIFYKNSVVASVRIVKREIFWKTETQFDPALNSGPADWDFDLQLMRINAKFDYIQDCVYHHEEELNLLGFIMKKTIYSKGGEIYQNKWKDKDPYLYRNIVKKQYDPIYRLFGIFLEKGKWKKLYLYTHLYIVFLVIRISMFTVYYFSLKKSRLPLNFFKNP
ncbi:hypothetical protein A3D83_01275 [Candidatus Daviesbacteria bacterium RIFCSPHIGHO2_02_FULL_41_10]|uniref:Glycosyltransferase 2-like domain-containing protein n=1 Tax=Candidatus Daviesbacteria bacterium RIFCSPHIGHO2_02_FULL_41_10 TaxID=1797774 RepID=A0A1F5JY80_9BACT|nr:MAG: hypothetical protein A3D83_01275 [Candidatus Daviesbacteria bacterium RIFCSPHIGHO2_02_FULL_41_10]